MRALIIVACICVCAFVLLGGFTMIGMHGSSWGQDMRDIAARIIPG
jgi:hypothetical protein